MSENELNTMMDGYIGGLEKAQEEPVTKLKEEALAQQEQEEPKEPEKKVETNKEYNLRILRERAEKAERRAKELEEQQRNYYAQQPQQQPAQQQQASQFNLNVDDESYVEGKHLKQYSSAIRSEMDQMRQQMEYYKQQAIETRLKSAIPDFDEVVTQENLKNLERIYPEDYASVLANPDLYGKGRTAYNMIKRYGINEDYSQDYSYQEKKIEENRAKPRAAATVAPQTAGSESPLAGFAGDRREYTQAQKDEIYKRSLKYSR